MSRYRLRMDARLYLTVEADNEAEAIETARSRVIEARQVYDGTTAEDGSEGAVLSEDGSDATYYVDHGAAVVVEDIEGEFEPDSAPPKPIDPEDDSER